MKTFDEYEMNENDEYEIPVGETFDYKGNVLKVVLDNGSYSCKDCFLADRCYEFTCLAGERLDGHNVIFEEVEG